MAKDAFFTVVGLGQVGEAVLHNVRGHLKTGICGIEKNEERRCELAKDYKEPSFRLRADFREADIARSRVVILAVKPQDIPATCKLLKGKLPAGTLLISVAAGVTLNRLTELLEHQALVRAMPNLALRRGKAVTTWQASRGVCDEHLALAREIFQWWGCEVQVESDEHMDMATALFGSGPAFVYHCMEAFVQAALLKGFPKPNLHEYIRMMVLGAVENIEGDSRHLSQHIYNVCSTGGGTVVGLHAAKEYAVEAHIANAIIAAYERYRQLSV